MTDLFQHALARKKDPLTSHDAALSLDEALPTLEARVLRALENAGDFGATIDELVDALGDLDKVTISPRLRPLCNKGLVRDLGAQRKGKSGRFQTVWVTA